MSHLIKMLCLFSSNFSTNWKYDIYSGGGKYAKYFNDELPDFSQLLLSVSVGITAIETLLGEATGLLNLSDLAAFLTTLFADWKIVFLK